MELPQSELSAPTNDINVTAALALLTSHATFFAGYVEYGLRYPTKYLEPVAFLAPLNLLEEFSKPLSLSFRLLGNILADELTLSGLLLPGAPLYSYSGLLTRFIHKWDPSCCLRNSMRRLSR